MKWSDSKICVLKTVSCCFPAVLRLCLTVASTCHVLPVTMSLDNSYFKGPVPKARVAGAPRNGKVRSNVSVPGADFASSLPTMAHDCGHGGLLFLNHHPSMTPTAIASVTAVTVAGVEGVERNKQLTF